MDIDSIPPGVDFEEHVRDEIEICDVVLVLIGDDWLSAATHEGARRIDNPDDFVRLEIETALSSPRVSLVPVLVEGAEMPRPAELPESIRGLARINAIELSDQRWSADIERLAKVIRELEAQQEGRALRRPGTAAAAPADAGRPVEPSPTMKLSDVDQQSVQAVVATLPDEFRTKDVSNHPHVRAAHGPLADASNYHAIIGRYLSANHVELDLGPPLASTDDRGAVCRKTSRAPQQPVAFTAPAPVPQPSPMPTWTAGPPPPQSSSGVGWVMVVLPLISCGMLAFVPSIWVAVERRSSRALMTRAIATGVGFFVLVVVAFVLIGTAPTDEEGSPSGAANSTGGGILIVAALAAAVLALVQRNPAEAVRPRS